MQTPMSSEEAAMLSHPCPSLPRTLPSWWRNWFQNGKQKHQKKSLVFRQVLAFLHTGSIVSFISCSAGLLGSGGGGRGLWTGCRLWLGGRSFSRFLLSCLRCCSFFLCLCLLGLWLLCCLLGSFFYGLCRFLFGRCFLRCRCLLSFSRFFFPCCCCCCSPLLRLLLGLLKREAAELERRFLEREAFFLLLSILAGGRGALLWLGGSLSVSSSGLLLTVGFGALYILTTFRCLLSGSTTIDLDFSLAGILRRWRGIPVGFGMAILLKTNYNIFKPFLQPPWNSTVPSDGQGLCNTNLHLNMCSPDWPAKSGMLWQSNPITGRSQ